MSDTKVKYCCFMCPASDYTPRLLDDPCPKCGRPFGFVLRHPPVRIGEYKIIEPLNRGFYGAAYKAERGQLGKTYVVKLSPKAFYSFEGFRKAPFDTEWKTHARVSERAEHVVAIEDAFEHQVTFSDPSATTIDCNVTVLGYVPGHTLHAYTSGAVPLNANTACQIAIDLFRIRRDFEMNQVNHNDFHDNNLIVQQLRPEVRRADALDGTIRVVAIDLGSMSDESKSNASRSGDMEQIAAHIDALVKRLLASPEKLEDRDYRIALALQTVLSGLHTQVEHARLPNMEDIIEQIRDAYNRATHPWKPWRLPGDLRAFGDHYNAQTLESWNVPKLLVDPEDRWLAEVTKPGPQIITGMRGCGKTMLLRALDFHARAAKRTESEPATETLERITNDGFIGLFVSAQRLLDLKAQQDDLEQKLTRLFLNYALQAARALLHLKDIDPSAIATGAHHTLGAAVATFYLEGTALPHCISLEDLERTLERLLVRAMREPSLSPVRQSPSEVFSYLARSLRKCSHAIQSSTVLFLLDDVSTRYLELSRIEELLSSLLFQHPECAFKFTSEWQTIELGLRSPGRIHPIRIDRDVTVFDLGADVLQVIGRPGKAGQEFVARILDQRARQYPNHPRGAQPREVLGDVSLFLVARELAKATETSRQRKRVYRGLSCLTHVCVGDIGDIIKLYEEILSRSSNATSFPVSDEIQSESFRELSSRRLYDLNRRAGYFKDHALAFAQASHELLVRSVKRGGGIEGGRIRQYSSIYVRVVTDEPAKASQQIDKLRELIDAGVFVFAGGSARTKAKDANPIQQFSLAFRKIYGITAFISLGDRDRFELSGDALERWLESPKDAKNILLQNLGKDEPDTDSAEDHEHDTESVSDQGEVAKPTIAQGELFLHKLRQKNPEAPKTEVSESRATVRLIDKSELAGSRIATVITGLGFEDRSLASNRFLSEHLRGPKVKAIRYDASGHAPAIRNAWLGAGVTPEEIPYKEALRTLPSSDGLCLVDVSGLTKPIIFAAVNRELRTRGRVLVCHAAAEKYYPLQEDLEDILKNESQDNPISFLERVAGVLTGEEGPYTAIPLLEDSSDPSRTRALLAFASAKHERLFSLLDKRDYDYVEVIAPAGDTARASVALYAAEFVCRNQPNAQVVRYNTDDLVAQLDGLNREYVGIYGFGGATVELGLTGSKSQAIAAAVLAAERKIGQAWYVSPKAFDEKRFSSGVGPIRLFDIALK